MVFGAGSRKPAWSLIGVASVQLFTPAALGLWFWKQTKASPGEMFLLRGCWEGVVARPPDCGGFV